MGSAKSLADLLPMLMQRVESSNGLRRRRVEEAWQKAVGVEVAAAARVLVLRGETLFVEVESSALKQELGNFRGGELLEKMERELGSPVVKRIEYRFPRKR